MFESSWFGDVIQMSARYIYIMEKYREAIWLIYA